MSDQQFAIIYLMLNAIIAAIFDSRGLAVLLQMVALAILVSAYFNRK